MVVELPWLEEFLCLDLGDETGGDFDDIVSAGCLPTQSAGRLNLAGLMLASLRLMPDRNSQSPVLSQKYCQYKWEAYCGTSGVVPANQTKKRSVHELFAGANLSQNSMWIVLVFPRKNTRIRKKGWNSWTFRFGPFCGLVCRENSWVQMGGVPRALPFFKA